MAKGRKLKKVSNKTTELLDIDELKAISSGDYEIEAMSPDTEMPLCIECNGPVENHGRFCRELIDVVQEDEKKRFARLQYYFYKYRCLDPECSTVFQKPVNFVSENGKVTKRYENEVMKFLLYESIDNARTDLQKYDIYGHPEDIISKPAIAKMVKRWVKERDQERKFGSPVAMAFFYFRTYYCDYVIVTDISKEPYRIIEVISPATELGIRQFMEKVDYGGIYYIVTDYNPIIVDTIKMLLPDKKVVVSTDSIKFALKNEFKEYIFSRLKTYSKYVRGMYLATPEEMSTYSGADLAKMSRINRDNKDIKQVYNDYARLYGLLNNHRDILEVIKYVSALSEDTKNQIVLTVDYLKTYEKELINYQYFDDGKGNSLYDELLEISTVINRYYRVSTTDIFRARILYSEFEKKDDWRGIEVSRLLDLLRDMIKLGGLKEYER